MAFSKEHKKVRGVRYPKNVDPSTPFLNQDALYKKVYERVGLPQWAIKKALDAFFAVLFESIEKGNYIRLVSFGDFIPIRRPIGFRNRKDMTKTAIYYRWKVSSTLKKRVLKLQTQEVKQDVDGS